MQCMATARTQHLDIYASRVFHARVLNCLFAITTTIADRFICFLLSKTKQSHNHIYAFNMKAASINILLLLVFAAAATTAAGIRRILLYSQHRRNPVCVLPDIGYSSDRAAVAAAVTVVDAGVGVGHNRCGSFLFVIHLVRTFHNAAAAFNTARNIDHRIPFLCHVYIPP